MPDIFRLPSERLGTACFGHDGKILETPSVTSVGLSYPLDARVGFLLSARQDKQARQISFLHDVVP